MNNYDNPVKASLKNKMLNSLRKFKTKTKLGRNERDKINLNNGRIKWC